MIGMVTMVSPFLTLRGPSSSACVRSSRSVWATGIRWSSPVAAAGGGIIAWARLPRSLFPDPGSHHLQNVVNNLLKKLVTFAAWLAGVAGLAGWPAWPAWLALFVWPAWPACLPGWPGWLAWLDRLAGWLGWPAWLAGQAGCPGWHKPAMLDKNALVHNL